MYRNGSIFSGLLIGLAGWIYLSVGGIPGAILFAVGLACVVWSGSSLYTGKAGTWNIGFYTVGRDLEGLAEILVGNVIGCFIVSLVAGASGTINPEVLTAIYTSRESSTLIETIAKGIGCGFLMEMAVWSWKEKGSILGVLLCVPAFILSGMYHSVADSFYYLIRPEFSFISIWLLTVLGNFIGCNIRRLAMPYK